MESKLKKLVATFLAGMLLVVHSLPVFAADGAPQPILDARDGVVRVVCYVSDGRGHIGEGSGTGTGFAVGTEDECYIVTNHHVIEGAETIYVLYNTGEYVEATVYEDSEARDIAVLKLKREIPDLKPLPLETAEIDSGMAVYALGFPGAADMLSGKSSARTPDKIEDYLDMVMADKQSMTMTNGIISAIYNSSSVGDGSMNVKLIQTNTAINSGNSGGPLLDSEGNIVGVNTMSIVGVTVSAVNGSVHVDELLKVLKSAGIEYSEPVEEEEPEPEPEADSTLLIVLLVIGAILVAGVVILLVVRANKRKTTGGIEGGTSFGDFERSGRVFPEITALEMIKPFLNDLVMVEREADINLLLTPDNVAVGDTQIVLKSKKPTKKGATTLEIYPGYSAPENYRNRTGPASAVYFVGAMMYRMVTGERPADALGRMEQNQPAFTGGDTLQSIINQAMQPYEQNRIAGLYQLLEALYASSEQIIMENQPPTWPDPPVDPYGQGDPYSQSYQTPPQYGQHPGDGQNWY